MPQLGKRLRVPMQTRSARQLLWQSMRVLREFTIVDLVTTAESTKRNAQQYVQALTRARYLRQTSTKRSTTLNPARFRLIRNTGPLAPRAGRTGVLDPNTGEQFDLDGNPVCEKEAGHEPE